MKKNKVANSIMVVLIAAMVLGGVLGVGHIQGWFRSTPEAEVPSDNGGVVNVEQNALAPEDKGEEAPAGHTAEEPKTETETGDTEATAGQTEANTQTAEDVAKQAEEAKKAAEEAAKNAKTEAEKKAAEEAAKKAEEAAKKAEEAARKAEEERKAAEEEAAKKAEEEAKKKYCYLTIRCDTILNNMSDLDPAKAEYVPSDGMILYRTQVVFWEGETVFDVLKRTCDDYGILIEYGWTPMYNSYYIEGMSNIYEFDCGPESGWMYKVNGWFPNYGCSSYTVSSDDDIVWCYTCKGLGADVGAA